MWRFDPTSVPSRYGTKHQSNEAKEAGSGRGLTRHFGGSCGLLLSLIHRLSVLLLDLVQATASLLRVDVRNPRKAIHCLLPRRIGGLLIASRTGANIGEHVILHALRVGGVHKAADLRFQAPHIRSLRRARNR